MAIRRPEVGLLIPIERPWPDVGMATLGVIFLVLVQHSSPLPLRHLLREVVEKVNEYGPFIGVVMAYSAEEEALISSGFFTPNLHVPWVDLSGRRFHIGTISDVDVIYVMSGQRRLNAGITVQILIDVFDVRGIVHYGTAGSANDSMSFGDVSVPKFVAFTGSWNWVKFNTAEGGNLTELSFGTYNLPGGGENRLAEVEFKAEEFYCVNRSMEEVFWLEMDTTWFQIAGRLKTAMSSGVPAMVFRGVSDLAGGGTNWTSTSLSSIAASNSLTVAVEFIRLIGSEKLIGRN
ncbi:bark storage protein A-like isoform X2 [Magnolia sinica]|uniref:bark storage protein A-like isoform X2 n=1 Tax=Magnolia sinica TaxID=86752 RepID=UPI00265B7103|nr:bark storage protein A-like isoform X2 [Magnolia sinica]